jgi:citrate lyase alpha subunit
MLQDNGVLRESISGLQERARAARIETVGAPLAAASIIAT